MTDKLEFSIVTPSLNMLPYLKRCHASIADQESVTFEHIVMDAVSIDGTIEWLEQTSDIVSVIQKDEGMYDAVNNGWLQAEGQILSYLNCDEQYLPGTLEFVKSYFAKHPEVDLLFGDALLVGPSGNLMAYRKGYQPRWQYIATSHLYVLSCTMFIRRKIIDDGFLFDTSYKVIGDSEFVVRLLQAGYKAAHVNRYLSAFTMTGENMSQGENALRERTKAWKSLPAWLKLFKYPLSAVRLTEKVVSGAYSQQMPLDYALFSSSDLTKRTQFRADTAPYSWKWPE